MIDRIDSPRMADRFLRASLNPVTDWLVDAILPFAPFALQRRLLNYKVLRAVFAGYCEPAR
jgi:hypothetical protein